MNRDHWGGCRGEGGIPGRGVAHGKHILQFEETKCLGRNREWGGIGKGDPEDVYLDQIKKVLCEMLRDFDYILEQYFWTRQCIIWAWSVFLQGDVIILSILCRENSRGGLDNENGREHLKKWRPASRSLEAIIRPWRQCLREQVVGLQDIS